MGVSQNHGYLFGGPHNKDYSILGSILGPLILGNYHIELVTFQLMVGMQGSRVGAVDIWCVRVLRPLPHNCVS